MIAFGRSNPWPEPISSPVDRQVRLKTVESGLRKNPRRSSSRWRREVGARRNVSHIHKNLVCAEVMPRTDYASGAA
jgi:hypothetical protein